MPTLPLKFTPSHKCWFSHFTQSDVYRFIAYNNNFIYTTPLKIQVYKVLDTKQRIHIDTTEDNALTTVINPHKKQHRQYKNTEMLSRYTAKTKEIVFGSHWNQIKGNQTDNIL